MCSVAVDIIISAVANVLLRKKIWAIAPSLVLGGKSITNFAKFSRRFKRQYKSKVLLLPVIELDAEYSIVNWAVFS